MYLPKKVLGLLDSKGSVYNLLGLQVCIMNNYEYTRKTIPKDQRILISALILLGTLLLSGYVARAWVE